MKNFDSNLFVNNYLDWLKGEITTNKVGDWIEVTTPFLDRHNDYIQIYVTKKNGSYFMTDDGYTISDLEISGCELDSPHRKNLLDVTLNGFGVKKDSKNALFLESTYEE